MTHSPSVEWAGDTTNITIKVLQTNVSLIKKKLFKHSFVILFKLYQSYYCHISL